MRMTVVGIDLGTTNTVVAAARAGRSTTLKDDAARSLVPSVVSFHPQGHVLVGVDAKQRRTIDARNTIFSVKRLIGRSWDNEHVQQARQRLPFVMKEGPGKSTLVEARGDTYTLAEISAYVLRRVKEIAEMRLGESVDECIITVPANFNDLQRAATKVAGRLAGLEVLRILNEPTAAALAYGFGKGGRERLAIYDFGGGTFDVTLLDLNGNVFEVLATAGDTFLGGDDIDRAIAQRMAQALLAQHRVDAEEDSQLFERLRVAAEELKIELTTSETASVTLAEVGHRAFGKPIDFEYRLHRAELEALVRPFVDKTLQVCSEALEIAGLKASDFDQLLMVGGSTRLPLVQRTTAQFWGRTPHGRINPDEVVALGAAIQAAALRSNRRGTEIPAAPTGSLRPPDRPSNVPSWQPPAPGPRPRLASIPPQMDLSVPPPRPVSPPAGPPPRRSEQSLLRRLEPRTPSQAPGAASSMPRPLLGVGAPVPPPPNPPAARPFLKSTRPPPAPTLQEMDTAVDLDELDLDELDLEDLSSPSISPAPTAPRTSTPQISTPQTSTPQTKRSAPPPSLAALPPADFSDLENFNLSLDDLEAEAARSSDASFDAVSSPTGPVDAPLLIDVTPLSLGVEVVGGFCDTIIERNSPVPCEQSRDFVTARDAQTTVRVRVCQGQSRVFDENTLLGNLVLTDLRPAPRGTVTVRVTFALDESGILSVSAVDSETGVSTHAELRLVALGGQ